MHDEQTQFEQDLRSGLKHLADLAPAGAGVEGVRRRLRRRTIQRTLAGAATAAATVAIAAVWLVPLQHGLQPPDRPSVPGATPHPMIAQSPSPESIPADAGPQQIQAAVFGYLSSVGVRGQVLICKEPGETLYYAVNGDVQIRPDQLHDHLAEMLRSFKTISIERRGRDVRCMLVADGPTGNTGESQQHKEHV